MNPTVRLYGRVVGYGSHAQVTAGFAEALRRAELLAGLVALDRDLPPDAPQPGGAMAPVGVLTGQLGQVPVMRQGARHQARYVMLAPNSSVVPRNLIGALEAFTTEVMTPSDWATEVVRQNTTLPVRTVPHGVAPGFAPNEGMRQLTRERYQKGAFDVLHLATSERERKGTRALLEAWQMLLAKGELPTDAKLRLVLDMEAASRTMAWMAERAGGAAMSNVALATRLDYEPAKLAQVYAQHHLVVQPSRGEGFGLCPIEALVSGVPIAATKCTGHGQWFTPFLPGAVLVENGPDAEIDDMPGALAPTVEPDAIAAAIRHAYAAWSDLDKTAWDAAPERKREWAWEKQLAPFVEHLKGTT